MCYPCLWGGAYKQPLQLIGSGFPLSLSEWSFTICSTPYNRKSNVFNKCKSVYIGVKVLLNFEIIIEFTMNKKTSRNKKKMKILSVRKLFYKKDHLLYRLT